MITAGPGVLDRGCRQMGTGLCGQCSTDSDSPWGLSGILTRRPWEVHVVLVCVLRGVV